VRTAWLLLVVQLAFSAPSPAWAQTQAVQLSGVVRATDGTGIAGATVSVGGGAKQPQGLPWTQLVTDDQGRWHGAVPFAPTLREFATAPGFIGRGYRDIFVPAPNAVGPDLQDTLGSIFEPDPDQYAQAQATPPTVADFVSDTGVSRSQVLPTETSSITVTGTVGQRDGHAVVRGDGYVARPDDFVDQVPVSMQGDAFSVVFPITHGPGAYRVEINDATGGAVINVPVYVGVPYQAEAPVWADDADLAGNGPVSRALDALQQVRRAHGLAPYALDPRLDQVAQDHVDDMVAHNWICHCWADGSTLLDHLRAAGIEPARIPLPGQPNQYTLGVGNGISTAPGAAAITGLFASPGHRLDLLGAYTHVGIAYGGRVDDGSARLSIVYAVEK
jgi:uncharacterized protein YkwD